MPKELYDADGNKVEAFEKEEYETLKQQADAKEKELAEAKEKLGKLESKDFNFKKLRDMTDAEREKLSVTEMELKKRQESLEEETRSFRENVMKAHMDDALAVLAGEDDELRKKIMLNYDRIRDEAVTREDINRKMKDAYRLTQEHPMKGIGSMASFAGASPRAKASETVSDELKALGAKMGLKPEEIK